MSSFITDPQAPITEPAPPQSRPAPFAGIGLLLGFLGLASTILAHHFVDAPPPAAGGKVFKIGRQPKPPPAEPGLLAAIGSETLRSWGVGLGLAALAAAGLSWFCREGFWPGAVAAAFGAAAIAWMFLLAALVVLLLARGLLPFPEAEWE